MTKAMTLKTFNARFPDDEACLNHLMTVRYGSKFHCSSCGAEAKHHRVKSRRCFECEFCGHQVYPTAGTPFERTRTSLRDWFFVMFLFTTTRNGVSAKEIQRQLGVTYKTAWRMGHEIRKYMGWVDGDDPLGGDKIVEADKAFIGGKDKRGEDDKTVVLGIVERGGDIVARVIPSKEARFVIPTVLAHVKPGSRIATDEGGAFKPLTEEGYRHATVKHRKGEYVRGAVHTNSIEAFWASLKRGISGTHVWVSSAHLPKYLAEFEFRHNLRKQPHLMFDLLLQAFPRP
ncbi:MAG: IS1595 family transposase [Parvibaculum sp.]|uniref:IS1595 family transposase n=1 Tax=Parvibaculum sp. TaxID=2024848 RepID=UPI0032EC6589